MCVKCTFVASVAQWIEHFSPKEGVVGSIPIWGTCMQDSRFGDAVRLFCFIPSFRYLTSGLPIPKSQASDFSPTPCAGPPPYANADILRRYGYTPLPLPSPYRRKPHPKRRFGNTHAPPLSPYRRKTTSLRRYGHTHTPPLSPNRRKSTQASTGDAKFIQTEG